MLRTNSENSILFTVRNCINRQLNFRQSVDNILIFRTAADTPEFSACVTELRALF